MDKIKVHLKDIEPCHLNSDTLRLVAVYVRLLKQKFGISLKMQDKDILMQISDCTRKLKDSELNDKYKELKKMILVSVHESMTKKS